MIKKRTELEVSLGNGAIKYRTLMESEPVEVNDPRSKIIKYEMLHEVVNNPDLAGCGPLDFEKLTMEHENGKWVIKTSAVKQAPEET